MTGLRTLLPATVGVEETHRDLTGGGEYAEEAAAIARAVPARRAEFRTGRTLARRALVRLGHPPGPLPVGPRSEPVWPAGFVGSITHCRGYRAAAAARAADILTLGIDAEPHEPLPEGVAGLVMGEDESRHLALLADAEPGIAWDRVLFSAKESIYKAWFPLMRAWLDFTECVLEIDPSGGFRGTLRVPGPLVDGRRLEGFAGGWTVAGGHIVTAVCLRAGTEMQDSVMPAGRV